LSKEKKEEVKLQESLEAEEFITGSVFDTARAAIFIARDGRIEFANGATCWIFGYSLDEVVASPLERFLSRESAAKILGKNFSRSGKPGESDSFELLILNKNDREIPVEAEIAEINYKGYPATLVILHDGAERKKLDKELRDGLEKLEKTFGGLVEALNKLVEARDPYTVRHQRRVAGLVQAIAIEMDLDSKVADGLSLAAMIHDIGKIAIPSEILNKPGPLTNSEWGLIKNHVQIGYDLLKDVEFPWPVAEIIYQHHERLDGSGYPRGLKEGEIRIEARILAVADVVEAMSSLRPYRESVGLEAALGEIEKNKGILYDPAVVEACLRLFREKGYELKEDYK
jgi:PAS domain S-box-containing protein/putative nucleotidyltransferase with HDIG domain